MKSGTPKFITRLSPSKGVSILSDAFSAKQGRCQLSWLSVAGLFTQRAARLVRPGRHRVLPAYHKRTPPVRVPDQNLEPWRA